MKVLIPLLVVLAALLAGFIGFVVHDANERTRGPRPASEGLSGWASLPGAPGSSDALAAAGPLVATISHGERVDFSAHVVPGTLTVFDFTADW